MYSDNTIRKLKRSTSQLYNTARLLRSLPKKEYSDLAARLNLDDFIYQMDDYRKKLDALINEQT
jgi:hypothetical protein